MTLIKGFLCEDCGCGFSEPEERRHYERGGEELDPPSCHCPECGSEFFEPAEKCEICGEMHSVYELEAGACEECRDKLAAKIKKTLKRGDIFSSEEIYVMMELLELGGLVEWD